MKHAKEVFNGRNADRKLKLLNEITAEEYFEIFEVWLEYFIKTKEQISKISGTVKELKDEVKKAKNCMLL